MRSHPKTPEIRSERIAPATSPRGDRETPDQNAQALSSLRRRADSTSFELIVDALTDVALERELDGSYRDMAAYIADVLATVAANVGSVDRFLAGRAGSWQASYVEQLLTGTIGPDDLALGELWRRRTRPLVVPLHIAELVEARHGLPGLTKALDRLDDGDPNAWDTEASGIEGDWVVAYQAYGERFAAVVRNRAADLGLLAPVQVVVNADPSAGWWSEEHRDGLNPDPTGDALEWLLWERAAEAVELPVNDRGDLIGLRDLAPAAPNGLRIL